MTLLQAAFLGLVQGLGEFLPISSSAHLVVAPWLFKFPDPGLAFDVALHFGTLIALVAFFWREWFGIGKNALQHLSPKARNEQSAADFKLLLGVVLATIPAAVAGLVLEKWAEEQFRSPLLVAINMLVMGGVLWFADTKGQSAKKQIADLTIPVMVAIGVAQALALLPGVSRSGATITMALLLGFNRSSAARFSFLLSAPIILGACVLKAKYISAIFADPAGLVGVTVAAISGFLSIGFLLKLVQTQTYRLFCYYRFIFGILIGALALFL